MRNNYRIGRVLLMLALCVGFSGIASGWDPPDPPDPPPGVDTLLYNQPYNGPDGHPSQRFDAYLPVPPAPGTRSPIIFMVHGGGWDNGDKRLDQVYLNKTGRWVPRDFVFVSVNYRLINERNPDVTPLSQAKDVAQALAKIQELAPSWNADPTKVILMGHSAGAHLISLVHSRPIGSWNGLRLRPWLGTISIDGAALNVVTIMDGDPPGYYVTAFGDNRTLWELASPIYALKGPTKPWLGICSPLRPDYVPDSCEQSQLYEIEAERLRCPNATVQEEKDIGHDKLNDWLGFDEEYTRRVEAFMRTLDPAIASRLP